MFSARMIEKRGFPESGVHRLFYFNFFFLLIIFNSSGNAQRSQDAILLLLVSSDNHLSRKHLFFHCCHCLCGVLVKCGTVSDFLFLFRDFILNYAYILNNAIILPVCNICVEIWLYIILLYVSVVFSIPGYFS